MTDANISGSNEPSGVISIHNISKVAGLPKYSNQVTNQCSGAFEETKITSFS
jgi:hypothetical protein